MCGALSFYSGLLLRESLTYGQGEIISLDSLALDKYLLFGMQGGGEEIGVTAF